MRAPPGCLPRATWIRVYCGCGPACAGRAAQRQSPALTSGQRRRRRRLEEWLTRIEHSIKPSMVQNWRNFAAYYVVPYIGQRDVQDIDGAVCDALYAKLLAEGRVKAKPRKKPATRAVHVRRLAPDGKLLPCLPHRDGTVRCYRRHAENDPLIGQPIEARKPSRHRPGRPPKRHGTSCPPAWNLRRLSTHTACCTGRGKTSRPGDGRNGTSSMTPSAPRPAHRPQGLDRRPTPDVPATRTL